jgi:hypothetical protein
MDTASKITVVRACTNSQELCFYWDHRISGQQLPYSSARPPRPHHPYRGSYIRQEQCGQLLALTKKPHDAWTDKSSLMTRVHHSAPPVLVPGIPSNIGTNTSIPPRLCNTRWHAYIFTFTLFIKADLTYHLLHYITTLLSFFLSPFRFDQFAPGGSHQVTVLARSVCDSTLNFV